MVVRCLGAVIEAAPEGWSQRQVLAQDGGLEGRQLRAGGNAELVGEQIRTRWYGAQGVGLAMAR